jgi:hypothetical protein
LSQIHANFCSNFAESGPPIRHRQHQFLGNSM